MVLRLLAACCAAASVAAATGHAAAADWARVELTAAAAAGAVCLDGSPGGYFIR